jgi:hypothetical protein
MLLGALVAAIVAGGLAGPSQASPAPGLSSAGPEFGITADPPARGSKIPGAKRDRAGSPSGTISPKIDNRAVSHRPGISGLPARPDWMDEIYPVWAGRSVATLVAV